MPPEEKQTDGGNQEAVDEVFDSAFEQAEDITPKNEEKPEVPVKEEPKAEEEKKPEQKPGESDEAYEQRWRTLQGIYRHEKDEWKDREAKLQAELDELKTKAPIEEKKEGDDSGLKDLLAKLDLTPEQKAQLAEYDQEFDIVSSMEGLKREQAIAKLKSEMLETINSFKKEFQTQLEPANKLVEETVANREVVEKEKHFQHIRDRHPDFETYRDDGSILKWIETKPMYLQKALKESYSQGTAQDIVDLLNGFKDENDIKGNVIQFDKVKEERKKALTPPNTRRGAVNASMSAAADFEGAFDEALNKNQ